jgi:phosphoglycerate dehydrogenase-like enzyme
MRERTPFPADLITKLRNLKLLLTTGVRNASLDLNACRERGIPVAGSSDNARGTNAGTDSTTQHCVAMILAAARNIVQNDISVKSGGWQTGYAIGLNNAVFGTVGLGRLGLTVSKIMREAFGMKIIAWSTNLTQEAADEKAKSVGLPVEDANGERTFRVVRREELFSTSDIVSLHLVLSERSRGTINAKDLALMKKSALFINTSRGPLVVEKDLLAALKAGQIRGAALDVFELEPLPLDSEWRTVKWGHDGRSQVLLTPHMGYVEVATLNSWYQQQVENIKRWRAGDALTTSIG